MTVAKLLIVIGLSANILGSGLLTRDLILTKVEAIELAAFYRPGEERHERRRLLEVQTTLNQSRNAQIGLALMIFGFVGQLIGTLLW